MIEHTPNLISDPVDPQVRQFVSSMSQAFAAYPDFDRLPFPQARQIAEAVRRPWREGGPVMAETEDLVIPHGDDGVKVRVHRPAGCEKTAGRDCAALVYLHGGGWTLFSLDTHDRLMREYAERAGVVVIGVDYALSPEAKYPVALNQTAAVVRWLSAHGADLGVDPDRVAIGGDSAGANLSLATTLLLRGERPAGSEGSCGVRAMLLNYGAFDVHCSPEADTAFGGERFMLGGEEMGRYWTNYLRSDADAADPLANTSLARLEGLPPAFVLVAACDVLAEQDLQMADRMAMAGVEVELAIYEGATHSFLEAVSISSLADRALEDGARWIKLNTAPRPAQS